MGMLRKISNWFMLVSMVVAADLLAMAPTRLVAPGFMIAAAVPLLVDIFAGGAQARPGLRLLAMSVNWVATVVMASLAAAALTGIGGTFGLFPMLGAAAALYAWNAIRLAVEGTLA